MPPDREKFPGTPPREAIEYFRAKGLQVGFNYTDVWKEEHTASFTAAKVMEQDILDDLRAAVQEALEEGRTFREFAQAAEFILDKSGWSNYHQETPTVHRLRTIYQTNMRVARAVGQWERIERTKALLPFLRYELGPSVRHREEHQSWEGTTLPVDDPWWDDHNPPSGWGCKCHIRQIGTREVERLGGPTRRPPSYDTPWRNPSTGEVEMVPVGIDPGWNYNPGKDRMRGLRDAEESQ